jgi:hypothetical protein
VFCLSARNSKKRIEKRLGSVQPTPARSGTPDCPVVHRTVSDGAPDIVRCARLVRVNSPLSGLDSGVRLIFTGLPGGAPDCPVSRPR